MHGSVAVEQHKHWRRWQSGQELLKLTFSASKTLAIYFRKMRRMGRKRNPTTTPLIQFQGTTVKCVKSAKYLRIMVDNKLNGMAHCKYIRVPCKLRQSNKVLGCAIPPALQVERESSLGRILRLGQDVEIEDIHIKADDEQYKSNL